MRIIAILILVLIVSTTPALAQVGGSIGDITGENVSIILDPQYPNPGDRVTATIDDYALNSFGSTITWYFDGLSAPGVANTRIVTFTAPAIGKSMDVVVRLTAQNGQALEAKRTITPLYLDLIIEPQTYTPLFYQGRALPTKGSIVFINALLQNSQGPIDPSKYSYNWSLNGKPINGGAKMGANWAQITVPYGQSSTISITIQDKGGAIIARKLVAMPSVPIELHFYEISTLLGQSTRAITSDLILTGQSTTIKSAPYYLDTRAINGNLVTQWDINNQPIATENADPFQISLSRGVGGNARVGFKVTNLSELLQNADATFTVRF